MSNYDKLKGLLAELFQFDQADLDFGIYRIMNQKRDEISRFLDEDLLPQVKQTLEAYQSGVSNADQAELQEAIKQAQGLGIDPDSSPKVQELRAKLGPVQDVGTLEEKVFSHLYDFFRRYYSDGDFISLRRYKEGVYAIPYEGEEVKLYWANHDQYYVKSSENFRDYTFKLPDDRLVHFRIVEAETTEGNNKPSDAKDRRFMLAEDAPVSEEDGELLIRFVYTPDPAKRKQEAINAVTAETVFATQNTEDWLSALRTPKPTESSSGRTLLHLHLNQYTKRNTFDYFIHKDLDRFLRRELDFYIKNEVMHLDDIEGETLSQVEQYLSKLRALRNVAGKLIAFLSQLENFQKRLWLKKKFVVETNYCTTLDRVPEELYPQIMTNEPQIDEWRRLFAIDEIGEGLLAGGRMNEEFLKANPYLVLDTAHFSTEFTNRLLQGWDGLDDQGNGLLVNGDNFQALTLLATAYTGRAKAIYIDPPYNTAASEILYKNDYKHSSWLSMMDSRLRLARSMMDEAGTICVTIDDAEFERIRFLIEEVFGGEQNLGTVLIRNNPQGRSTVKGFAVNHEFAMFYAKSPAVKSIGRLERSDQQNARYDQVDDTGRQYLWENFRKTGTDSNRADRPKQYYPLYWDGNCVRVPEMTWDPDRMAWDVLEEAQDEVTVFWPDNELGVEKVWKYGYERVAACPNELKVDRGANGELQVFRMNFLNELGTLPGTWWDKAKYAAGSHGTNLLTQLFGVGHTFPFPKSVFAVEDCLSVCGATPGSSILDFFAGSGTTGHAVVNLNRLDGGNREYTLVEVGEHFDSVLLPRIKKIIYSEDWRDGKPVSREGSSHLLKYIRLESYEDALNNLVLARTPEQQLALDAAEPEAREQYMLSYMLNLEATGSQSLLNLDAFRNPFEYKLKVYTGIVGETKTVNVDLVETFNYLIGLRVKHIDMIRRVRVVEGASPAGERVLILWRDVDETNNDALDEWFRRQGYNTRDLEYDIIYVNGDNNLANLRRPDQTWKVRLIEADFHRLMFDGGEV